MTHVIKHALRAGAGASGGYNPEGWNPKLKVTLLGPSPGGAELVWTVTKPDGSAWFEHRVEAPELAEGDLGTVDLQRWEDGTDIDQAGQVAFTLSLVSELDGIDELLHDGSFTVTALEGEHRYAVDFDWLASTAFLCLDSVDQEDAPKLKVTTFLKGAVDSYQVEAHCFFEGKRFAQASNIDTGYTFTSNTGDPIGQEVVAEFDDVRGWNNLTDQGWGEDSWHLLDAHDGAYQVKLLREKKVTRIVSFEVAAGRLVSAGAIELDQWVGPVLITDASVEGDLDGPLGVSAAPFYGDAAMAAAWASIDDVYALRTETEAAEGDGAGLDDETQAAMQAVFDRSERLINTWADTLENGQPPFEFQDVLQAEAVVGEEDGYLQLRSAAGAVPDDFAVELNGEATTIGALHERTLGLFREARTRIEGVQQADQDALAPYRALLANDKLAVFEDHPAPDFRYYTTNKHVIETPEELAEAEFWFFEGVNETRGTGTVDGESVDVVVEGWRVLGWKFDADGNTVDEFETQGQGGNAPKSAFTR